MSYGGRVKVDSTIPTAYPPAATSPACGRRRSKQSATRPATSGELRRVGPTSHRTHVRSRVRGL